MQSRMQQIGRYEIERELGRGAMGIVYLARDSRLGRAVALKTIRLSDFADPDKLKRLRERLIREAQSAGSLTHENIVTIYDVDELDDISYISMEFVEGDSLERMLEQRRELSRESVLSLLRQIAGGLDFAHSRGIVHRDVKPANIMVTRLGRAKITDFGVAKITYANSMTQGGTMLGTPDYMSPEQVEGIRVDGRADQFSLAVIAFELLTGEKPFAADSRATLLYRIAYEPAPDACLLNPTLSAEIGAVLAKAMAKKAEDRFSTCMGFVDALTDACRLAEGWHALPRGLSQTLPTAYEVTDDSRTVESNLPKQAPASGAKPSPTPAATPRMMPPLGGEAPPPEAGFITGPPSISGLTGGGGAGLGADPPAAGSAAHYEWLAHLEREEQANRARKRRNVALAIFAFLILGAGLFGAYYLLSESEQYGAVQTPTETALERPGAAPEEPAENPSVSETDGLAADVAEETETESPETASVTTQPAVSADTPGPAVEPVREPEPATFPAPVKSPPAATPPKPAERAPAPPPQRMSTVRFVSDPPGATVNVNTTPARTCVTPCSLELAVGRHTYSVRRGGFRNEIRVLEVGNYSSTVNVRLQPVVGMVRVTSDPAGASVSVNGEPQSGVTPMTLRLPPGRYTIVVERHGRRMERSITVREDEIIQLSGTLPE